MHHLYTVYIFILRRLINALALETNKPNVHLREVYRIFKLVISGKQNILGFRGWNSDHARIFYPRIKRPCLYLYLQCKQQARKYYPRSAAQPQMFCLCPPKIIPAIIIINIRYTRSYLMHGRINGEIVCSLVV